jgi:hypothetical protein
MKRVVNVDNESWVRCVMQSPFVAITMALSWSRTVDLFADLNPDGHYEEQKSEYEEVEFVPDSSSTNLTLGDSVTIEEKHTSEKKLVRKVDLRLLPIVGMMYAISVVDRSNVK